MAAYLVERYAPATQDPADAATHVARLHAAACVAGSRVLHVWSILLATDETVLCLFEAPDAGAVADLNRRAAFPFDRITAVEMLHGSIERPGSPCEEEDR